MDYVLTYFYAQGSISVNDLSKTYSDIDESQSQPIDDIVPLDSVIEKVFVTGVLDELKICFSYNLEVPSFLRNRPKESSNLASFICQ